MTVALFPARRVCEICGDSEAVADRWSKTPREAHVAALNTTIYRRIGHDRRQLATAAGVRVCEKCIVLASQPGRECDQLGRLLVTAIIRRYSVMTRGGLL
jgi:hypothetical protein